MRRRRPWSDVAVTGNGSNGVTTPTDAPMLAEGSPHASITMYADLIEAALAEVYPTGDQISSNQERDEVIRRRKRLASATGRVGGRRDVTAALADQVAYDVALIRLARSVDVRCDPRNFGWPRNERQRVERTLANGGVLPAGTFHHP
jgi:hypothetical protein